LNKYRRRNDFFCSSEKRLDKSYIYSCKTVEAVDIAERGILQRKRASSPTIKTFLSLTYNQWLKWSFEAIGLTWRSLEQIPHPTNLALFGHKITLYRFNQGAHTIAGGLKSKQELSSSCPLTLTTAYNNIYWTILVWREYN